MRRGPPAYAGSRSTSPSCRICRFRPERAGNLIRECVVRGTTHLRTHVDLDRASGLAKLDGVGRAQSLSGLCNRADHRVPAKWVMRCPGVLDLLDGAVRIAPIWSAASILSKSTAIQRDNSMASLVLRLAMASGSIST